jgi:hypothetical protein
MSAVPRSVCLRVSGAVAPSAPALKPISPDGTVLKQIGGKHSYAKAVNAAEAISTSLATAFTLPRQATDPLAQFLDTATRLV